MHDELFSDPLGWNRFIKTKLPENVTNHLEREWPCRQQYRSAQSIPGLPHDEKHLDYIEEAALFRMYRDLAARQLIPISSSGPVWTRLFFANYGIPRDITDKPGEFELPWNRGEQIRADEMLICRITATAIPPIPEEPRQ